MRWDAPLKDLPWIGAQRVRQLSRAGLETAGDLVSHFPKRWEDRTRFDRFPQQESDTAVCVCGIVQSAGGQRFRGRARSFEVTLVEEGSHEALLAQDGLYARYWKRQSGGFIGTEDQAEAAE